MATAPSRAPCLSLRKDHLAAGDPPVHVVPPSIDQAPRRSRHPDTFSADPHDGPTPKLSDRHTRCPWQPLRRHRRPTHRCVHAVEHFAHAGERFVRHNLHRSDRMALWNSITKRADKQQRPLTLGVSSHASHEIPEPCRIPSSATLFQQSARVSRVPSVPALLGLRYWPQPSRFREAPLGVLE